MAGRSRKLRRVFLLSPARVDGVRAGYMLNPDARFELAQRFRSEGLALAEVFTFTSGLYFRGKITYARALARARAFAATVTGVDLVLRIDDAAREIWIAAELDDEHPLDRPLLASEARVLERALASLHERGIAHGHVDRAHVILSPRTGPRLRFEADAAPTATPDLDRLGLAALRQSDAR